MTGGGGLANAFNGTSHPAGSSAASKSTDSSVNFAVIGKIGAQVIQNQFQDSNGTLLIMMVTTPTEVVRVLEDFNYLEIV